MPRIPYVDVPSLPADLQDWHGKLGYYWTFGQFANVLELDAEPYS